MRDFRFLNWTVQLISSVASQCATAPKLIVIDDFRKVEVK